MHYRSLYTICEEQLAQAVESLPSVKIAMTCDKIDIGERRNKPGKYFHCAVSLRINITFINFSVDCNDL